MKQDIEDITLEMGSPTDRVTYDDGQGEIEDQITDAHQKISDSDRMDDEALSIGRRYAEGSDTAESALFNVVTGSGAEGDVSVRDQWKRSADNLVISDGVLENTGDSEDEAMMAEGEARLSADYGHSARRKGQDTGVLFDSIDRNEGTF